MSENLPKAFLITPLSAASAGGIPDDQYAALQESIEKAAAGAGVSCQTSEDIFEADVIVEQIRNAIELASVVIAVCTGKNANVFYEMGLAEVLGHKPVLIAPDDTHLPFDKKHWRCNMYGDLSNTEEFETRLTKAIEATLASATSRKQKFEVLMPANTAAGNEEFEMKQLQHEPTSPVHSSSHRRRKQFKMAIKEALVWAQETSSQNLQIQPNLEMLEETRDQRFALIEHILNEAVGTSFADPDQLGLLFGLIRDASEKELDSSGYNFWRSFNQSWSVPLVWGVCAYGIAEGSTEMWKSLGKLLATPSLREADCPFAIRPEFTWPDGLYGNSDTAFNEATKFFEASDTVRSEAVFDDALSLTCKVSFVLGMRRCVFESQAGDPVGRAPYSYAGFVAHSPRFITDLARAMRDSDVVAQALGAPTSGEMNIVGSKWYPSLRQQWQAKSGIISFSPHMSFSWEELLELR